MLDDLRSPPPSPKMEARIKTLRIPMELKSLKDIKADHGITCTLVDESDYTKLRATVPGPRDSPYASGIFHLTVTLDEHYPFRPPTFKFITPIFHPNIDSSGQICLDLLKMPPAGCYNPAITLETMFLSIQMLIANPNSDDPLEGEPADLFKENIDLFNKKAKEHTEKYATKTAEEVFSKTKQ